MALNCIITATVELIVIAILSVLVITEYIMLAMARRKNKMLRERLVYAEGGFEPVNPYPGHWSSMEEPDLEV